GRWRFPLQLANVQRLFAFHNIVQQNIHERMLAVERCTALVLGDSNPLNRREVKLAEGVILRPKQTSPPIVRLSRINPTVHDPPAYEHLHSFRPLPSVKQQSVHAMGPFINGKSCQRHEDFSCSAWTARERSRYF